ncbi:hypothetical protein G7046_g5756 [Stylonectria norvegica]|nr:hypothetical protein G7046_g5756 [Stylonectria norvegica]
MSSSTPDAVLNSPPVAAVVEKLPSKEDAKSGLAQQLRALAAGGFGGICAVVVGHPFDLIKVRLQTAERGVYSSAVDVVRKSIARDGVRRGLYAGVSAPLVGVTPMSDILVRSRRLLLGLRPRQTARRQRLDRRSQRPLHRANLRRRLLLRGSHDSHHGAL